MTDPWSDNACSRKCFMPSHRLPDSLVHWNDEIINCLEFGTCLPLVLFVSRVRSSVKLKSPHTSRFVVGPNAILQKTVLHLMCLSNSNYGGIVHDEIQTDVLCIREQIHSVVRSLSPSRQFIHQTGAHTRESTDEKKSTQRPMLVDEKVFLESRFCAS